MTPSTGVSEKGSNILSDRRMKSGFSRYLRHAQKMNIKCGNTDVMKYLILIMIKYYNVSKTFLVSIKLSNDLSGIGRYEGFVCVGVCVC